jgi:hypothetical protein
VKLSGFFISKISVLPKKHPLFESINTNPSVYTFKKTD